VSRFPRWISHRINVRNVVIQARVVLREPLRIGAGRREGLSSLTDLPVLRVNYGGVEGPVIPGSSWKGGLRSHVESLLRAWKQRVCGGVPGDTCAERGRPNLTSRLDDLLKHPTEEKREIALRMLWTELCLACKIFGAPSYMSNVVIEDSYPVELGGGSRRYSIGIKPGIAIDRRTGAVKKKAFYRVEFIEPGSEFGFRMRIRNLPNYALGLIACTLLDMEEGNVRLGGFKSRGFGWVEFKDLKHSVSGKWEIDQPGGSRKLIGFTEEESPWYDPLDEDVVYSGGTKGLLEALCDLAERKLGGGTPGDQEG